MERQMRHSISWWTDVLTGPGTQHEFHTTDAQAYHEKRYLLRHETEGVYNLYCCTEMKCDCGEWLQVTGDVECDSCGALYNAAGQRLVDRELWEEPYEEDY